MAGCQTCLGRFMKWMPVNGWWIEGGRCSGVMSALQFSPAGVRTIPGIALSVGIRDTFPTIPYGPAAWLHQNCCSSTVPENSWLPISQSSGML